MASISWPPRYHAGPRDPSKGLLAHEGLAEAIRMKQVAYPLYSALREPLERY